MTPYFAEHDLALYQGRAQDVLPQLPADSVNCVVTSPPYYGLRDYGVEGQLGLEETPAEYVATLAALLGEVRRVLRPDGTVWLNLGDSYSARADSSAGESSRRDRADVLPARRSPGVPAKNLLGIPWRVAFALQDDGWTLRRDIIWHKSNAMPESVRDRPSASHEYLFLLTKSPRYWFDLDPIRVPLVRDGWTVGRNGGRGGWDRGDHLNAGLADAAPHPLGANPGDVWTIATQPYPEAHFATFPAELARRCIGAGCPERVCAECGHAAERITDTSYVKSPVHGAGSVVGRHDRTGVNNYDGAGMPRVNAVRATVGWTDCGHSAYRPGVVLDPFAGSGTTLMVARQLLRKSIGIELKAEYCELAVGRIGQPVFEFGAAT